MPEFILDHGTPEAARAFAQLDAFTQGYIEAMFFTDASDPDDGDLQDATTAELAPDTLAQIVAECSDFQTRHAALLAQAYACADYGPEQAGRDFWFTRNGHGAGFWDRDQLDELGDALSELCGWRAPAFHEINLYRGDDGKVYLS